MGTLQLNTPDALGPVRDSDASRVCSLAGIEIAKQKLVLLEQLRDGLDMSLQELESQRRTDQIVNKAFLVARFTKATCDAFISMAATLAETFGGKALGHEAKVVAGIYGGASPLVEAASGAAAGQPIDWVKAGTESAKNASSLIPNQGYELLAKGGVVKVEVIKSALNQDKEGVIKSAMSYIYDLHAELLEMADADKSAALAKIGKDAFEYNEKIGKAFDEMLDNSLNTEEQYLSRKATISHQGRRLSAKITELQDFVTSCSSELGQTQSVVLP